MSLLCSKALFNSIAHDEELTDTADAMARTRSQTCRGGEGGSMEQDLGLLYYKKIKYSSTAMRSKISSQPIIASCGVMILRSRVLPRVCPQ